MHNLSHAKVLIVGDIMLDRYWEGETSRISPEAPVPVVHVKKQYAKAGGAGNVALNIASLQGDVSIVSITGLDNEATELTALLKQAEVNCLFQTDPSRPTITKLRLLSQHQQLIRSDFEETFAPLAKDELLQLFTSMLKDCEVVVLSDYGKGTLSDPQSLICVAREAGKVVLVDPKGTDFKKYYGASIVTPNLKEFCAVVGPCHTEYEIEQKGKQLIQDCNLSALLVTRGAEGMSLIRKDHPALHIPTEAREVFDVTGAGDTVIAVLSMALAVGNDLPLAMRLANVAAGIVVGKLGTATISPTEFNRALHKLIQVPTGILTETQAKQAIELAHLEGDSVVMTNGCFDILHAGHVDYLQKAKALGNRLLIAVNTDESIQGLKGPSRPINALSERMRVLAALSCVDWVLPFREETPERLIKSLLPDVLVKGADYQIEEIAGAQAILTNGGRVTTIELTPGCSTSKIIEKIRGETA